jgi:hypothetical protein
MESASLPSSLVTEEQRKDKASSFVDCDDAVQRSGMTGSNSDASFVTREGILAMSLSSIIFMLLLVILKKEKSISVCGECR